MSQSKYFLHLIEIDISDTKEASKLLERATRLLNSSDDGNHKLSLKQLLVGDSDSDTEQETTPASAEEASTASTASKKDEVKASSKKKAGRTTTTPKAATKVTPKAAIVKKPVKKPTPGTRRSSRLKVPADDTTEETSEKENPEALEAKEDPEAVKKEEPKNDSDDEDDNQLVIDETPEHMEVENESPVDETTSGQSKKGRGRPKRETGVKNEVDIPEVKTEENEVKPEIKEEVKEVEDVADILKPKTRNRSGSR